jgi:hypothetical protein
MSVSSKVSVEGAEDLSVHLRNQTEDAYRSYRIVRQTEDADAAHIAWTKYGMLEDAAIRFDNALESVKAILASEI